MNLSVHPKTVEIVKAFMEAALEIHPKLLSACQPESQHPEAMH